MIMVGNKCDLQRQRSVTNEMIEELKSQLHLTYLETSAKTRQNVDEVFFEFEAKVDVDRKCNLT